MKKKIASYVVLFCLLATIIPFCAVPSSAAGNSWLWPVASSRVVTSNFGWRNLDGRSSTGHDGTSREDVHCGIDIGAVTGSEVKAAKAGTVVDLVSYYADYNHSSSMGNYVVINHGDGTYSRYLHLLPNSTYGLQLNVGDYVQQGALVGYVGNTGSTFGTHLHFQICADPNHARTTSLNPMPTNAEIRINNVYDLPSGWPTEKITYVYETSAASSGSSTADAPVSYNNKGYDANGNSYPFRLVDSAFSGVINQKEFLKVRPYGAESNTRVLYAGDSVSIVGYATNHYGNKWYKTSKGDWVYSGGVDQKAQKPVLSISGQNAPSSLKFGSNFGLRGMISTNCGTITNVYGAILNASGNAIQQSSYQPNSTSHDLRNSINNDLLFNNLPTGDYTYRVTATAANGSSTTTTTLINSGFSVVGGVKPQASTLEINVTSAPTALTQGQNYGLRGAVSSNYSITEVRGYLLNLSGSVVESTVDRPNASSMDIRTANLNNEMIFNTLSSGSYILRVVATDTSGKTVSWEKGFTVGGGSPAVNTRIGVVSIPSSWDNLSIRSGPSTGYGIIGSMNHGATCTVYPDRAQNGWYYVSYNGVTGYAAGNYIILK